MFGSGAALGVSNEFMINNIHHLNIPALTTLANGTGTLLQYVGQTLTGLRPLVALIIWWKK